MRRRGFLKASALGLAASAVPGCEPADDNRATVAPLPFTPPSGVEDRDWADVRAQFVLEPGTAYLNNASLGMPPAVVAEAVCRGYEAISREPLHGKHDLQSTVAERVVPGLASFVGGDPGEIALTRNATEALHLAALGISLNAGDEVLLTTQEHPAGSRPWELRALRHGVLLNRVFVPSPFESGDQVVDLVERALTPRTKVVAFCHVTRGGHRYPVKDLAALARDRGIISHVDGAQAMGMFPVDLHDLGCDTYSVSLHKWLLGPIGTGMLYVREGARDRIRSVYAHDATPDAPAFGPPGTVDLPVRAALAAALEFALTIGTGRVAARTRYLSDHLKARLADMSDVTLLSGATRGTSCPGSTIFEMTGVDAVEAVRLIEERARIHIDEHQRDGHDAIRISTHIYNTEDEIDRLINGLESLRT